MILITGAAGYIGSHCALNLLEKGEEIAIFDNLSTGHIETIEVLKKYGKVHFFKGDLLNIDDLKNLFSSVEIDTVVHFASLSQVGESVVNPQKYYQNNVVGTINLLNEMIKNNVKKIIFSSTAAIYGEPEYTPIDEKHPKNPVNPYGKTKLAIENILDDYDSAYGLKSIRLRYFNVVGADSKTRIGEWHENETHLVPNILKSTFNNSKTFELYGNDYNTKDGSCIRDYINIEDLICAHVLAIDYLKENNQTNFFNLGTSCGNSVLEIFKNCENITNKTIPIKYMPKRLGDPVCLVADNKKALNVLGWKIKNTLESSIKTAYEWEKVLQKGVFDA